MGKNIFYKKTLKEYLGVIKKSLEESAKIRNPKGAYETVKFTLTQLERTGIEPCRSADYIMLDNGPALFRIISAAQWALGNGCDPRIKIAYVTSWHNVFDPTNERGLKDFDTCTDKDTVKFLQSMKNLLRQDKEARTLSCQEAGQLVLSVEGWTDMYSVAKKAEGADDVAKSFVVSLEGVRQRNNKTHLIPQHIRGSVLKLHPQIVDILRSLRAAAKYHNKCAERTGLDPIIKIPEYITKL